MGGENKSTQSTNQQTKSKQKQNVRTGPWRPTQAPLAGMVNAASEIPGATSTAVTPEQNQAIGGLFGNAQQAIDQFNPQQTALINDLYSAKGLGQGQEGLNQASSALSGYLQPGYLDPNTNPYLQPSLNALGDQVKNSVSNQFALAGRDFSGDFSNALGKGYAQNLAPLLMGQYNQNVGAQQNAAGMMPGISGAMDASALNQLSARSGAAGNVAALNNPYLQQLATAQTQAGLPYTNLNAAQQFLLPIAGLGGTNQGTTSGTSNTTGTATMTQASNPLQTGIGAGLGGLGLLGGMGAFGSGGWLNFGGA